jgi:EAL domain-containing protein (putative c-di-GMP-specific phosphodiesterase class I)
MAYATTRPTRRQPVDRLKIDQSFIADLATDPLAHNLRLGVIAEGVENAE